MDKRKGEGGAVILSLVLVFIFFGREMMIYFVELQISDQARALLVGEGVGKRGTSSG